MPHSYEQYLRCNKSQGQVCLFYCRDQLRTPFTPCRLEELAAPYYILKSKVRRALAFSVTVMHLVSQRNAKRLTEYNPAHQQSDVVRVISPVTIRIIGSSSPPP